MVGMGQRLPQRTVPEDAQLASARCIKNASRWYLTTSVAECVPRRSPPQQRHCHCEPPSADKRCSAQRRERLSRRRPFRVVRAIRLIEILLFPVAIVSSVVEDFYATLGDSRRRAQVHENCVEEYWQAEGAGRSAAVCHRVQHDTKSGMIEMRLISDGAPSLIDPE